MSFFLTFVCISLFGRGKRKCANIQLVKVAGFVFFWNVKRDWWSLCFDDGCCIYVLNSNSQRLLKHTSSTFNKKSEIALKWADKMTQVCAFLQTCSPQQTDKYSFVFNITKAKILTMWPVVYGKMCEIFPFNQWNWHKAQEVIETCANSHPLLLKTLWKYITTISEIASVIDVSLKR